MAVAVQGFQAYFDVLILVLNIILKNLVSHREHRDHRGETNGYHEIATHLLGEPAVHENNHFFLCVLCELCGLN
jgi:hypothetical protein